MTNRNSSIDIAKGIGILLVVFGHNWIVLHEQGELFRVIFSFHMPLFFFLAGIFLRTSDEILHFATARASSILKPYFVILLGVGALKLLKAYLRGTTGSPDFEYFTGVLYGTGNTIIWVPLWFLPHLFIASVASLIILKTVAANGGNKAWMAITACMIFILGMFSLGAYWHPLHSHQISFGINNLPGLPWSADLIPITSSFIIFGYLFGEKIKSMAFSAIGLWIALAVFVCLHYFFDDTINLNLRIYGNPIVSTLQAGMGIYIIINIASLLQNFSLPRNSLAYIGSGSLFILIFHFVLQEMVTDRLLKFGTDMYLISIASFIASITLSLAFWEVAKRQKFVAILLLPNKINTAAAGKR